MRPLNDWYRDMTKMGIGLGLLKGVNGLTENTSQLELPRQHRAKFLLRLLESRNQLQMAQFICRKLRQNQSSCLSAITNGMNNSQTIDEVLSQDAETHHNTQAELESN